MGGSKVAMPPGKGHDEKLARLRSWDSFAHYISELDNEAEVESYIDLEKKHFKRAYVMLRLVGRRNALRTRRERMEIIATYGKNGK